MAIPGSGALRRVLETSRGNHLAGGGLILGAGLLFAGLRNADDALYTQAWWEAVFLFFGLGIIPATVLCGLILLLEPARPGLWKSALLASLLYAIVGLGLVATGIPGYVPQGAWYLFPSWPMYVLWLHECALGFGIWPCPAG